VVTLIKSDRHFCNSLLVISSETAVVIRSQKKECENLSDEMKEKIDNLTGQIVLIRKVAESKQADNDKLCSENKNLNIKVEELNEKLVKECKENDSMRHKCKEQDNSVTHLENELSDVNTRLKDTDKVLEEKSTLLQEKIHITSLQDEEIDSLKISLQNLEKEAAAFKVSIDDLRFLISCSSL
jgi:chromosome segregation ATPase